MRGFDRFFGIVVGLLLLAVAALLFSASLGIGLDRVTAWLNALYADRLLALILFLVMGMIASYMVAMGLRRRRNHETIQYSTPLGDVRISVQAIEDLAYRAAKRVRGVRDATVGVKQSPSGVAIMTNLGITPDVPIPEITNEIRTRLESYIRETAGVNVTAVEVTVRKITGDVRTRVE